MNLKRLTSTGLALVMAASLVPAALAAELPEGWTPADGARDMAPTSDLLIAPAPTDMPQAEVPAPNGGYSTVITVNGKALESFDFDREVPGWGSQTVTWKISELDTVPKGYVPMRAIAQADHGSSYWYAEENQSWFNMGEVQITVLFDDMSVTVNDEPVEGVKALLLNGVTYLPVSVIDGLEGYAVADTSADGVESYEITTPNGTPIMKLAYALMETAGIGMGMKSSPAELEEFYGESFGFKAEYMTEGVAFLPMMTTPDTLVLGKLAEGKEEALKESFEAFRKSQAETFEWYLSHNLPKVENAQFVTEGDWFMFLIGENADEAAEQFKAAVKDME